MSTGNLGYPPRKQSDIVTLDIDTPLDPAAKDGWSRTSEVQQPGWRIEIAKHPRLGLDNDYSLFFKTLNGWQVPTGTLIALWTRIGSSIQAASDITSGTNRCSLYSWASDSSSNLSTSPRDRLKATIVICFPTTAQSFQPPSTLYATLNSSLDEGHPVDVRFHVFNRRSADGTVRERRVISAVRKWLLRQCSSDAFVRRE